MTESKPRVVSLFCGAGGLDLGFADAGFRIVYATDWDKDSCDTYRANIGDHVEQADVAELKGASLPQCEVVIGGPPCQGFSVAGHMDPDDPRSKMVWHFVRLVRELAPKLFVMENVKALSALSRWRAVREELMYQLCSAGYRAEMLVLNARDFGVPQSRERVFFIGTSEGLPPVGRVDATCDQIVTVRDVLEKLPEPGVPPNLGVCKAKVVPAKNPVLRRSLYAGMLFNGQGRPTNLDSTVNTLPATMGGNRTPIVDEEELRHRKPSWVKAYHRRLMAGGASATRAPARLRRITVTEAALLQTFPLGFEFSGRQTSQYRQIGNAVPAKLGRAVAEAVMRSLNGVEAETPSGEQLALFH